MASNLDKYKADLRRLTATGGNLLNALQHECLPNELDDALNRQGVGKDKRTELYKKLPSFKAEYQAWYSEAKAVVKQLLPDRLTDFVRLYEKPNNRKDISYANYTIEDGLHGLTITRGMGIKVVGPDAGIPLFTQQLSILKSAEQRFESSLFDIKQLVQADVFDSELDSARELNRNKFTRAAGAIAGVVLEKHLRQVCDNHNIKVAKKNPTISDLNDVLKAAGVIETPEWRFIQHLADVRNLCDHDKQREPTQEQVSALIDGVDKENKTLF